MKPKVARASSVAEAVAGGFGVCDGVFVTPGVAVGVFVAVGDGVGDEPSKIYCAVALFAIKPTKPAVTIIIATNAAAPTCVKYVRYSPEPARPRSLTSQGVSGVRDEFHAA